MNILIGTPAYNGLIHLDYLNSIIGMQRIKLPISVMGLGNESLIPRGRNTCISYFHELKDFTHLFFLDADIGIKPEDVAKLLSYNEDVIAAPVPLKGFNGSEKVYNVGTVFGKDGKGLLDVEYVGTAVLILSRKACDALVEHAKANNGVYTSNKFSRGVAGPKEHYDVFKTGVDSNKVYLSEDFYVCKTLRELGFNIKVDETIQVTHTGMFQF